MAGRLGITYEQVMTVAEDLLKNKVNPTIEKIRVGLGNTGSNLTISRHLNEWRNTRLPEIINNKLENLAPPDPVNLAVKDVWEKLKQSQLQELERLKDLQVAEVTELKSVNHHLNDCLINIQKELEGLKAENALLKEECTQIRNVLEEEREARLLAQGALDGYKNQVEQQFQLNEELKTEHRLALMELKGIYSEEVATLKLGLTVAKDAMEEYRTRYAVDIDNLRTKKEQLEEQVFNLSLARRDAESLKHRLKLDLEIAQKESENLKQEFKLSKNTRSVIEDDLKAAQLEIIRLNKSLEAALGNRIADAKNYDNFISRIMRLEKRFERDKT